jgi:D-alanyl-D-alanine carboxypeptidase/D-alanyl-D-alanine-endopeptidase (penicillin-binding protein 4)
MRFSPAFRAAAFGVLTLLSACASLPKGASDALDSPDVAGVRWGLVVMTMEGRELVSIRPDERFLPASNTKMFTVAAAFHRLGDTALPDPSMGASVRLVPNADGAPDLILAGGGDPFVIDAEDCERDCLSDLATMVAANGITRVRSLIADDTLYPYERWGPGWSQDDTAFRAGAPASALVVNSNEVRLEIAPGGKPGDPVRAAWRTGDDLLQLANNAVTIEGDKDNLRIERLPGSSLVRLFGTLGAMRPPQGVPLAVEDPALAAAMRFRRLLEARGVTVEGAVVRHRSLSLADEPEFRGEGADAPAHDGAEIARLLPPTVIEELTFLMKQSQNLHAEQFLRRLGLVDGDGSRADGLAVVEAMLTEAGADRRAWDFSDGSGMSVYNRVTPRMVARFLLWTSKQAWGDRFRGTMPVGGVDGTLSRRFRGTPLEGRVFAKTGTLMGTNALSGFMTTKSGKTLIFSAYANDRPSQAGSATVAMDAALNAIAAAH